MQQENKKIAKIISVEMFCQNISNKSKGFTLVELIIVITILSILGTIAYISFQGYTKDARDGVRMSDIKQIYNGLSIYKTQTEKTLLPDNYINIQSGTTTISYQGYAGASVLRTLKMTGGKDPGTKDYYIYTTDVNTKKAQLMTYMETSDKDVQLLSQLKDIRLINQANAVTNTGYYQDKKIYVYGDKIGILTNNKVPLQETTTSTGIDITTLTGSITTYFGGNVYSGGISTSTGLTLINQINSQITNLTICDPGYSLIGGVCTLMNYFMGAGTSINPYRINGVGLSDTTTVATSCNYYNLNATTNTLGTLRGAGTCGNGSQECFSSGIYLIDTDGVGGNNSFQVYCDMSINGGGYTLVGSQSIYNAGNHSLGLQNSSITPPISETINQQYIYKNTLLGLKTLLKCKRINNTIGWVVIDSPTKFFDNNRLEENNTNLNLYATSGDWSFNSALNVIGSKLSYIERYYYWGDGPQTSFYALNTWPNGGPTSGYWGGNSRPAWTTEYVQCDNDKWTFSGSDNVTPRFWVYVK